MVPRENVELMDVSPKQLVSVASSLIPFLENDDANRALMGVEHDASGRAAGTCGSALRWNRHGIGCCTRFWRCDRSAQNRCGRSGGRPPVIVIRATEDLDPAKPGVDIYRLQKYQRSNQSTCINQRPLGNSWGSYFQR